MSESSSTPTCQLHIRNLRLPPDSTGLRRAASQPPLQLSPRSTNIHLLEGKKLSKTLLDSFRRRPSQEKGRKKRTKRKRKKRRARDAAKKAQRQGGVPTDDALSDGITNESTLVMLTSAERCNIVKRLDSIFAEGGLQKASAYPHENDYGPTEYKLKLCPSVERLHKLTTQMRYRLDEGKGECQYRVGVADNGSPTGIPRSELKDAVTIIHLMAAQPGINADVEIVFVKQGTDGFLAELKLRQLATNDAETPQDVRLCVAGDAGCGKTTLIGVLCHGELDDGEGWVAKQAYKHKHEMFEGESSAINREIIGFDNDGSVTNYSCERNTMDGDEWKDIVQDSQNVVELVDLPGSERYLRTAVKGVSSNRPDHALLVTRGDEISDLTREHFSICWALRIPISIVVNAIEEYEGDELEETLQQVNEMVTSVSKNKFFTSRVESADDASKAASTDKLVPIFLCSCVTGDGLDILKTYMQHLEPGRQWKNTSEDVFMSVDTVWEDVGDVGMILGGIVHTGILKVGDVVKIGPTKQGKFVSGTVHSIHLKKQSVRQAIPGQAVSIRLQPELDTQGIRRGMALISPTLDLKTSLVIEVDIEIINPKVVVKKYYESCLHVHAIAATVTVTAVNGDADGVLKGVGQRAHVTLEFTHEPELVRVGDHVVMRAGRVVAVGQVVNAYEDGHNLPQRRKSFPNSKRSSRKSSPRTSPRLVPQGSPTKTPQNNSSDELPTISTDHSFTPSELAGVLRHVSEEQKRSESPSTTEPVNVPEDPALEHSPLT